MKLKTELKYLYYSAHTLVQKRVLFCLKPADFFAKNANVSKSIVSLVIKCVFSETAYVVLLLSQISSF